MDGVNSGILLVDKPQGMTSHDVVARVRRLAGTRKVGHAGTLDPMATGLLLIGVDHATRLLHHLVGLDKEYLATIRLGWATTTDDAEGEPGERADPARLAAVAESAIRDGMTRLTGEIDQVPSAVSAVKIDGKRAYQRVRDGEQVEIAARRVTVAEFELLALRREADAVDLDVRVACSSGTYVRALARDLGAGLGLGGHLTALRRTRIGRFAVADAPSLDDLDVASALVRPAEAARRAMPVLELGAQEAIDLGHGKRIPAPDGTSKETAIAAVGPAGRLVAIVERRAGQLKVVTGFPQEEQQP
ncbi:tRNA pseudouridine(55) synthase TruB [Agromyces sp. G08B096]|uniref:tRNA pseudouridine synthase B n=1 Tax=Agromyces sp. G08B096 TaxID=3156399 RepID=A0AAU7WC19_9MICO